MFGSRKMKKAVKAQQYKGFIVEKKPKSIAAEACRTLRTNIQYSSFDKQIKTIVITSAEAAEGKSTVSGNLALSFAQNEKKVIIMDCDFRKSSVHQKFDLPNFCGLSDIIIKNELLENAIEKYNENLYILSSGSLTGNPASMLSSQAMDDVLISLKKKYDVIILDTAPTQAVVDAQILSAKVDGH